jgi:hypothetical protein
MPTFKRLLSGCIALLLLPPAVTLVILEIHSLDSAKAKRAAGRAARAESLVSHDTERSATARSAKLSSLGLTSNEIKAIVLAQIEADASRGRDQRYRYWSATGTADARRGRVLIGDAVRGQLLATYGDAAVRDPVFAPYFRPLDHTLPFLSSDQQIRIVRARVGAGPGFSDAADFLDDSLRFEYDLRESPLAEDLRQTGFNLTETEFRACYAVLASLAGAGDAHTFATLRRRLRSLLGSQRFDQLWARRDPVFPIIRDLMAEDGFDEQRILAAYGVVNGAQDDALLAAQDSQKDPMRAMRALKDIADREESQLAELVGTDLARRILTSRAQKMFELSQQQVSGR